MATITEPTKIKLEFKEAVYMYGGDYNQGYNDGKDDGFEEGKQVGYDEGVEFGKANAPREERSVTYKANGSYEVLPTSSELLMEKVNVVVDIPDDGSYSEGYTVGYSEGEAYGKQNAPTEDLSVTLTSNGTFNYPKPSDKYYADVEVVVNVPSEKTPTQEKSITIRENGTEVISPDAGHALSKVTVITDVDTRLPEQTKEVTIKENGTTNISPDSGYTLAGVSVTTEIDTRLPEQEKSLEVTENKTYEVTPDEGYALKKVTVTGNVASSGGGDDSGQLAKITTLSADEWDVAPSTLAYFTKLIKKIDFTEFNKLKRTSFSMFFSSFKGTLLDVSTLDVSNANIFDSMFMSCDRLKSLDLSSWDTSKATSMYQMFSSCNYLETVDLSSFNTENVTDFYQMFSNCSSLKTLDLSHFNTSKATNVKQMFYNCSYLESLNLSGWILENVTDLSNMFTSCSKLTSLDLSSFNTNKVTSMASTFYGCRALVNLTLSENWASNTKLTSLDITQNPLSKASILDLADKIADKSDTSVYTGTQTVKLKSSQKSLFSEEELTALAGQFTAKNWTLAWS